MSSTRAGTHPKRSYSTANHIAEIGRRIFIDRLGLAIQDATELSSLCVEEFGRHFGGAACVMPRAIDFSADRTRRTARTPRTMRRAEDVLRGIVDAVCELLVTRLGVDRREAGDVAESFARDVCFAFRGSLVYMPLATSLSIRRRDEEIAEAFNGKNHMELARKYGVSVQTIYNALKRTALRKRDSQPHWSH